MSSFLSIDFLISIIHTILSLALLPTAMSEAEKKMNTPLLKESECHASLSHSGDAVHQLTNGQKNKRKKSRPGRSAARSRSKSSKSGRSKSGSTRKDQTPDEETAQLAETTESDSDTDEECAQNEWWRRRTSGGRGGGREEEADEMYEDIREKAKKDVMMKEDELMHIEVDSVDHDVEGIEQHGRSRSTSGSSSSSNGATTDPPDSLKEHAPTDSLSTLTFHSARSSFSTSSTTTAPLAALTPEKQQDLAAPTGSTSTTVHSARGSAFDGQLGEIMDTVAATLEKEKDMKRKKLIFRMELIKFLRIRSNDTACLVKMDSSGGLLGIFVILKCRSPDILDPVDTSELERIYKRQVAQAYWCKYKQEGDVIVARCHSQSKATALFGYKALILNGRVYDICRPTAEVELDELPKQAALSLIWGPVYEEEKAVVEFLQLAFPALVVEKLEKEANFQLTATSDEQAALVRYLLTGLAISGCPSRLKEQ